MKINKQTRDIIFNFLKNNHKSRDDDNILYALILDYKKVFERNKNYTGHEVLKILAYGNHVGFDSVARCRRKLQEENEDLRGKKFMRRQAHAKTVKKEIKQYNFLKNDTHYRVD